MSFFSKISRVALPLILAGSSAYLGYAFAKYQANVKKPKDAQDKKPEPTAEEIKETLREATQEQTEVYTEALHSEPASAAEQVPISATDELIKFKGISKIKNISNKQRKEIDALIATGPDYCRALKVLLKTEFRSDAIDRATEVCCAYLENAISKVLSATNQEAADKLLKDCVIQESALSKRAERLALHHWNGLSGQELDVRTALLFAQIVSLCNPQMPNWVDFIPYGQPPLGDDYPEIEGVNAWVDQFNFNTTAE